jgi:hypothetical protein
MRIIDGIKHTGTPFEIPDVGRRQLPGFFKQMGYKVGVEIGVQRGSFSRRLLRVGLEVYAVDPWLSYRDYHAFTGYQNHQDKVFTAAKENLKPWIDSGKCHMVRKKSMDAVGDFEDESLDFVYIDGHHGFKFVTEDIWAWSKKVRKGGVISGHDYAYGRWKELEPYVLQVKEVIDGWTQANRIFPWYVIGAKSKTKENERRDQYRSWMWFKGAEGKLK